MTTLTPTITATLFTAFHLYPTLTLSVFASDCLASYCACRSNYSTQSHADSSSSSSNAACHAANGTAQTDRQTDSCRSVMSLMLDSVAAAAAAAAVADASEHRTASPRAAYKQQNAPDRSRSGSVAGVDHRGLHVSWENYSRRIAVMQLHRTSLTSFRR